MDLRATLAWPGVPLALASAALFGASTPLAKLLLGEVDPWLLAGLLYLGSGIGLGIMHLGRRSLGIKPPEAPLRRADLPWLAAVILAGGVVGPVLLMLGLNVTPASSAALLLNVEGLATMAIAWLVFHENADRRIVLGALSILAGAVLLSWQGEAGGVGWGALAIVGACLAWGLDNNLTRKLSAADPVQIVMLTRTTRTCIIATRTRLERWAAASVGVAIGGGTAAALEAADAALMHERVLSVAELVALSRTTLANIRQNVGVAVGLKAVFLVTTLAGITGLWPAVLADTGATVLVTLNALRSLRWRQPAGLRPAAARIAP